MYIYICIYMDIYMYVYTQYMYYKAVLRLVFGRWTYKVGQLREVVLGLGVGANMGILSGLTASTGHPSIDRPRRM